MDSLLTARKERLAEDRSCSRTCSDILVAVQLGRHDGRKELAFDLRKLGPFPCHSLRLWSVCLGDLAVLPA